MRVLLVDDHPDTRAIYTALITNIGHEVQAVPTIAAAQAAAAARQYDLLICDILLPDGIGHDLMRDLSRRYGLKGIALTGCRLPRDIAQSRASGFLCHLAKPVDLNVLAEVLTKLTPEVTSEIDAHAPAEVIGTAEAAAAATCPSSTIV